MKRICIVVLDSFGIGGANDAGCFGDLGADTLGHIARYFIEQQPCRPLQLPNLTRLGLNEAYREIHGCYPAGMTEENICGCYGHASEISTGKDTTSGHWEIAGTPVLFKWDYFPDTMNSIPLQLLNSIIERAGIAGFLGNCHASGTAIVDELGEEHLLTQKPIFYTAADSVLQIACHEEVFGLSRLYELCEIARDELNRQNLRIGRVIARPFCGTKRGSFVRTGNRRDYSLMPPDVTVLHKLIREKQGEVVSIGKIADIFANDSISLRIKATDIDDTLDKTMLALQAAGVNTLVFANFVDFDSSWGHRRDPLGYGLALEHFDRRLPELLSVITEEDLLIITADHGCDPTWRGTDHTREQIPVLLFSPRLVPRSLGQRNTFADIGQTVASYFRLTPMRYGKEFSLN